MQWTRAESLHYVPDVFLLHDKQYKSVMIAVLIECHSNLTSTFFIMYKTLKNYHIWLQCLYVFFVISSTQMSAA